MCSTSKWGECTLISVAIAAAATRLWGIGVVLRWGAGQAGVGGGRAGVGRLGPGRGAGGGGYTYGPGEEGAVVNRA